MRIEDITDTFLQDMLPTCGEHSNRTKYLLYVDGAVVALCKDCMDELRGEMKNIDGSE